MSNRKHIGQHNGRTKKRKIKRIYEKGVLKK
jgi:hypothetical protein